MRETFMKEDQHCPDSALTLLNPTVSKIYTSISAECESLPGVFLLFLFFLITAGSESEAKTLGECEFYECGVMAQSMLQ